MTAYYNPIHGNDATAALDSRSLPYKTLDAAQTACHNLPTGTPWRIVETHKPLPPQIAPIQDMFSDSGIGIESVKSADLSADPSSEPLG